MKMYKNHLFAHVVRVVALSASAPFMIHDQGQPAAQWPG